MSSSFAGVYCHPNHEGNMCFECLPGFGKLTSSSLCESCSDIGPLSYFKFVVVMAALFIYTVYYVNLYTKVIVSNNIEKRVLLKILVNHLQQISIVALVDMGFSIDIKSFFSLQSYLSVFAGDILSIDCLMNNFTGDLKISKTVFSLVLPIILSFIFVLLWILASIFSFFLLKKKKFTWDGFILRLRLYILISFYMLYPQLISSSLSLMNCVVLDREQNIKALREAPNVICWDDYHSRYVNIYKY